MHDLRSTAPRWSKTAVVVVLVVFGLVLVVGIFGLWAFSESRKSSLQTARADALVHSKSELDHVHDEISGRVGGLLERVESIATDRGGEEDSLLPTERLRNFLEGPLHGRAVVDVFRVGPDRGTFLGAQPSRAAGAQDVYWFRGVYRMVAQPNAIEQEADRQAEKRKKLGKLLGANLDSQKAGSVASWKHWRQIAKDFGLMTQALGGTAGRTAVGVTYAALMLQHAADALDNDPAAISPGEARSLVMLALENASLNAGRAGLDADYVESGLRSIYEEIDKILDRLPAAGGATLRWEVLRFVDTRARVRGLIENGALFGAVNDVRKQDKPGAFIASDLVEDFDGSELLGIVVGTGRSCLIVRFDLRAIEGVVAEKVDAHESQFEAYGMRAHVFRNGVKPILSSGRPEAHNLSLWRERSQLPFRIVVERVGDPEGHGEDFTDVMFWVVIALAVAGLILAGRILIRLLTREVRLAQLKADFVSNLSHELKTPITSISLFTEMLEDGKITKPEDQAEAFSVLAQESMRLQSLVTRMIDVARGEARKTPYELISGDLNRPVLDAATRIERIVTESGLDLRIHLHPEPLPMLMDPSSMDDMVTNLLSNAWKYKRGNAAKVSIRTGRRGRFATLSVSDDGIGIPKSERKRVFEMFYRADQYLTQPVAGTGLGLALVRSVVVGHKGRINVEAGPDGVGSTFRIRFPLARSLPAQPPVGDTLGTVGDPKRGPDNPESAGDGTQTAAAHGKVASKDA